MKQQADEGAIALRLTLPGSGDHLTIAFQKMTAHPAPLRFAEETAIKFPKIAKAKQTVAWQGLERSALAC